MSPREFATLGFFQHADIKRITIDGIAHYAIHAADGRLVSRQPARITAEQGTREHNIEPVSVH